MTRKRSHALKGTMATGNQVLPAGNAPGWNRCGKVTGRGAGLVRARGESGLRVRLFSDRKALFLEFS